MLSMVSISAFAINKEPVDSLQLSIERALKEQQLGEIVVNGNVPVYKLTHEGVRINVSGTFLSQSGTADDVIRHIPGMYKVDNDKYNLFGNGEPVFYIDGRLVKDNAELSQLKSQDIAAITLITNPGAKYDASVVAVVQIKTVRRQGEGLSMDEKLVLRQSCNTGIDEQFSLNYRHKGVDVFGMFRFMKETNYDKSELNQVSDAGTLWQLKEKTNNTFDIHTMRANAGLNYVIDADNSLGVRYAWTHFPHKDERVNFSSAVMKDGLPYDNTQNTGRFEYYDKPTQELSAYYSGKVAGWSMDFNASWWHNNRSNDGFYQETNDEHSDRTLTIGSKSKSTLWATKLVLAHPLMGGNLSFGAEYTNTKREQVNTNPEGYIKSSNTTQRNYTVAPFVEYTHPLSFGSVSAGVRYEHNHDDYYDNGVLQNNESRTYNHFFPHLSLQTKMGQVSGTLSYGVSISRPSYRDLSEAVYYINQFTLQKGNCYLKPAIKNTLQAQAIWKKWTAKVRYSNTRDAIFFWMEPLQDNPAVSVMSRSNYHSLKAVNASISYAPNVGLWHPQLMVLLYKQWMTLQTTDGVQRMNKPLCGFQSANTFKFSKSLSAEMTLMLISKGNENNVEEDNVTLHANASITKTFLNDCLSIRLAGYDLFYSQMRAVLRSENVVLTNQNKRDSRYVELTLRYTYNQAKSKYKGTGAGAAERQRFS